MSEIVIDKEKLVQAYKAATADQKQILTDLYGKEIFRPQDITERIKTFDDAYCELGNDHPFVKSYEKYVNTASGEEADVIAYLKLRIICAALNEGWEADYCNFNQKKWFPWFTYRDGGLVFADALYAGSSSHTSYGVRLAYKTGELAEYAGEQFVDIYQKLLL